MKEVDLELKAEIEKMFDAEVSGLCDKILWKNLIEKTKPYACWSCGSEVEAGDDYCPNCGSKTFHRGIEFSCGNKINDDYCLTPLTRRGQHCPKCGAKMDHNTSEEFWFNPPKDYMVSPSKKTILVPKQ